MVQINAELMPDVFAAVADPTRRQMLSMLAERELPVKELQRPFAMSQPAITQHLRVLERAGLVQPRKSGRLRFYRLEATRLKEVYDWAAHYQRFWNEKLAALGEFLNTPSTPTTPTTSSSEKELGHERRDSIER